MRSDIPVAADRSDAAPPRETRGLERRPATELVPPAALRVVPMFADLSDDDLAWIAAEAELVELEPREVLFTPGEPAEWMFIGLEGVVQARREQLGPSAPALVFRAGDVGGTLPFSRMTEWAATGRAVTPARVARFPKARFPELLRRVPALTPRFVTLLIDRVRDATRREAQFEKLTALGKLSAALAHELNNPTSAVVNALADARRRLDERGRMTAALADAGVTAQAGPKLDALRAAAPPQAGARDAADTLARSDREDALARWLADQGVPDAWVAAATFADAGLDDVTALEGALAGVPAPARPAALRWLETGLAAQALFASAERTAGRIAQLVDAMRRYTNRDRGRDMADVDVREGIESTLALFEARCSEKGVAIERRYAASLPRIRAYPGDLNQVWGSLVENALDAAPRGTGRVTVTTGVSEGAVVAEVGDNGGGIPPELEGR